MVNMWRSEINETKKRRDGGIKMATLGQRKCTYCGKILEADEDYTFTGRWADGKPCHRACKKRYEEVIEEKEE